jgi:hypothetical protein
MLNLSFFSACTEEKDKIDFYLPENFHGRVVIIYNCMTGINPQIKNGRSQIFVPQSGIVKVKAQIKFGAVDYRYFITQNTKLVKLNIFASSENHNGNERYVGTGSVVTTYKNLRDNKSEQFAFVSYVHLADEEILETNSGGWIIDTLQNQMYYGE